MAFIKKVLIKGFKGYKNQTYFEEFNPRCNVIVGYNGSGKSSFFDAIRFVLCDESFNAQQGRQKLVYDGRGERDTLMSAEVEVHFDNSSGRFPTEGDTVVLRRVIGLKKDNFFLDKRHLSKAEAVSFLESAGFSQANPYFIVQQGRIGALATMRDSDRLALLLEVAGMRVYDERRGESMRLMADTDRRISKVDEVLAYIGERLGTLEAEREELAAYEQADRRRRALEYALCVHDHREAAAALARVDAQRAKADARAAACNAAEEAATGALRGAGKRLKAAGRELARHAEAAEAAGGGAAGRKGLVARVAKLELRARAAEERRAAARERAAAAARELRDVTRAIGETERRLREEAAPQFQAKSAEEQRARREYAAAEQRIDALYARQGRRKRFATREERDAWLTAELAAVRADIAKRAALAAATAADAAHLRDTAQAERAAQADTERRALPAAQARVDDGKRAAAARRAACDRLDAEAREAGRRAAEAEARARAAGEDLGRARRKLESSVSRDVAEGLAAVREIKRRLGLDGVYGPVIENFEVAPELDTAVEVTAGNGLFYVVVDTDDTAARILDELARKGTGRITCMPVNRIAQQQQQKRGGDRGRGNHHHNHDDDDRSEALDERAAAAAGVLAKPLLGEVRFAQEELRPVFQHLFGKTMLCPTQEAARAANKKLGCNCVTPDGVQLKKRGVWIGGFYDKAASRMEAMRAVRHGEQALAAAEGDAKAARAAADALDAQRRTAAADWREADIQLARAREERRALLDTAARAGRDSRAHLELAEQRERDAAEDRAAVQELEAREQALVQEVGSEFLAELTPDERAEVQGLLARRTELAADLEQLARERADLEATCKALQTSLSSNLYRKRAELLTTAAAMTNTRTTTTTTTTAGSQGDISSSSSSSSSSSLDNMSLSSLPLNALEDELMNDSVPSDDDDIDFDFDDDNNDNDEDDEDNGGMEVEEEEEDEDMNGDDENKKKDTEKRRRRRRRRMKRRRRLVRLAEDDEVAAAQRELEAARAELEDATRKKEEAERAGEAARAQMRQLREEVVGLEAAQRKAQSEAAAAAQQQQELRTRRITAAQRLDEAAKKIQSLGSLPKEALEGPEAEERLAKSRRELEAELKQAGKDLRAFSHVNKKARDQYVSFTDQRDQLRGRRDELGRAKASILGLITQLDLRKDEAVERTFRGVSKHFSDVFAELVPGGSANLVMLQREADDDDDDDDDNNIDVTNENNTNPNSITNGVSSTENNNANEGEGGGEGENGNSGEGSQQAEAAGSEKEKATVTEKKRRSRVDMYSGVAVKVSFPGNSEAHYMHQLSGGQQSLVALALILAIQRTDPAPFYLFDEVDANLDATYRVAVAKLVRKYSRGAQFIISSFHPEFVIYAQKWYRVTSVENISRISSISRDEALAVIRSGTTTDKERAAYDEAAAAAAAAEATEEDDDEDDDEEEEDEEEDEEDEDMEEEDDDDDDERMVDDEDGERMMDDEE